MITLKKYFTQRFYEIKVIISLVLDDLNIACIFICVFLSLCSQNENKMGFLFSLSPLLVCLLKLVYNKVTGRDSLYIELYEITIRISRIHNHRYNVNCTAIYELDPVEMGKTLEIKEKVIVDISDES